MSASATQKIFRIRRDYNAWVANETLEDYALRYATFTFIFFALEAAIMALALEMAFGWPLLWCYVSSSLVIVPMRA